MNNCKICSRLCEAKQTLCSGADGMLRQGSAWMAAAYAAICTWIAGIVISEAMLVKTSLIAAGVIIGATFSDFFKKHRILVGFVMLASFALFVYKVISELDEEF